MRFLLKFSLLVTERSVSAVNILVSSVILARFMSNEEIATYFFTTSIVQVFMSPWIPAAEISWLGCHVAQQDNHLRRLVAASVTAICIIAVPIFIAAFIYSHVISGSSVIVILSIFSTILYTSILVLLPSKFSQGSDFIHAMVIGGAAGIAVKLGVLCFAPSHGFSLSALFSEWFIISGLSIAFGLQRTLLPALKSVCSLGIKDFSILVGPVASIMGVLLAIRLTLIVAGAVLDAEDFAAFGLSFQLLNAASFIGAALTASLAGHLRARKSSREMFERFLLVGVAFSIFLPSVGYLAMRLVGKPILLFLIAGKAATVYPLVVIGMPAVAAVLLQGVGLALASVYRKSLHLAAGSVMIAVVNSVCFVLVGDSVLVKTQIWALGQFVGACIILAVLGCSVRRSLATVDNH